MSFFSKISNYFGSSSEYSNAALDRFNKATDHAKEVATNIKDGGFYIAPKITSVPSEMYNVASNTAKFVGGAQVANAAVCGSSMITNALGYGSLNAIASATSYIAPVFISPLGVAAVAAGSFIATHPEESFKAIKGAGNTAYNFVAAGVNLAAAAYDISIAGVVVTADFADLATDTLADMSEIINNPEDVFQNALYNVYGSDMHGELHEEINLCGVDDAFYVIISPAA